jgi:hypothetical protein
VARVGQFFTIAAVVIGSLLIGVVVTTSSSFLEETETATSSYFDSAVRATPQAVDDALADNDSVDYIKQRLYAHHRMVELSAQRRGIEYRAKHLVVLPPQNKALYINYAPETSTINLSVDGSFTDREVDPRQSTVISYGSGRGFRASIIEEPVARSFNATQTRSMAFLYMSTDRNLLRRTTLN